jgi:acetyl esterase/lipase
LGTPVQVVAPIYENNEPLGAPDSDFVKGKGAVQSHILTYGTDALQDMEIQYRKDQQNSPVVFVVHGGDSDTGDRTRMKKTAPLFTDPGFTVVMPNYRYNDTPGVFDSSADLACSIATFAMRATEYGADASHIVVMGFSHGGWVSSLTVYDDQHDWLKECDEKKWPGIDGYVGVATNFGSPRNPELWSLLGIADMAALETRYNDVSGVRDGAINYASPGDVPAFFAHGTKDPKFNTLRPEDFAKALQAQGVQAEVHIVEGGTHTTGVLDSAEVLPSLIEFVKRAFEL